MSVFEEAGAAPSAPVVLAALARAHVDALTAAEDGSPRAVIVGSAGSGKSHLLRHIGRALSRDGVPVVHAAGHDLSAIDPRHVVLVDDAHLLDPAVLAGLGERITGPHAGLIIACRPWPQPSELVDIARALEQTHPAIVLGHVGHDDVRAHVARLGGTISPACVNDILHWSGAVTWIVTEALALHDGETCQDAAHGGIRDALQDVAVHRLQTSAPALREAIELLCVAPEGHVPEAAASDAEAEHARRAGQAEGLLLRNGEPVPLIRDAVRATVPVGRLVASYLSTADDVGAPESLADALEGVRDAQVAAALLRHGEAALRHDPRRAAELLRHAREAGADVPTVALAQARAAWALGAIDTAAVYLDESGTDGAPGDSAPAADLAAAIWAARGLASTSAAVYRSTPPQGADAATRAALVCFAAGDLDGLRATADAESTSAMPSTRTVALELLGRGIRSTLTGPAHDALNDLVRAAEMYTASGDDAPMPELPAVVATLVALDLGEVDVAHSVIEQALRGGHGGVWARDRLQLWRAWVALQQERPYEAETSLQCALTSPRPLSPRDRLLADAILVALARRYSDSPGLLAAWRRARETLLRARFDMFSLLPLGEFVVTAARVGEPERMASHFADALALLQGLGSPPVWSPHLHWTGIQRGILLNRPDDLAPHARELVAAARHNTLAAMMAQAGRVWTSVLTGTVDPEAIETAAYGLAAVGLAWDGARLAGHGAGRSEDRRVISRLLACARHLHPREETAAPPAEDHPPAPAPRQADTLSAREREVAVLVLQGKTYAEIGATIFISPRTAEHHIARIRGRLGATTRSDLIAKLRLVLGDAPHPGDRAPENGTAP